MRQRTTPSIWTTVSNPPAHSCEWDNRSERAGSEAGCQRQMPGILEMGLNPIDDGRAQQTV